MAPDLKYIFMTGISNSETISVMDVAFKMKAGEAGAADSESKQAVVKNDDDLSEVVFDYLGRKKSAYMKPYEAIRDQDKSRKDKNFLSDEKVQSVAVWIQQQGHQGRDNEVKTKEAEAQKHFRSYNHHHYFDRWGTIGPKKDKDEEWWISNPSVLPEDHPDFLCDMCRRIDFNALLHRRNLPGNDIPGPTKIRLHGLDRLLKRKHCTFCRLIADKITIDGVIDLADEERLKFVDIRLNVIDDGDDHGLRLEIELEDPLKKWPTQRFIIQKMECGDGLTFRALAVDKDKISPSLVSAWSQICEGTHGKGRLLGSDLPQLRLIDVIENRICNVTMPCRFVALSYVWGGVTQVQNVAEWRPKLQNSGGLLHDAIQLPKTITDAMEVTRWLGIRYLWVDSLCIEQDNESDKREIISKMGSIYSGANLTIVAASNQNPHDGLPGVTDVSRTQQQIRSRVQGVDLAVAFDDARLPIKAIEDSRWNSRGWTYQERQLSSRMIFFTTSQMIFTCSMGTFFEDTVASGAHGHKSAAIDDFTGAFADPQDMWIMIWDDPTLLHFENKAFQTDDGIVTLVGEKLEGDNPMAANIRAPVFEHKVAAKASLNSLLQARIENMWYMYREAATSFSARDFTDSRDVLPAFEGLANVMCQGCNIQFWYNLPDSSLTKALLWYPRGPMRRRVYDNQSIHPSWSWAGWEGSIKYRDGGWLNSLYCGPVSAVQWMQKVELESYPADLREQFEARFHELLSVEEFSKIKPKVWTVVDPVEMYHIKTQAALTRKELGWRGCVDNLSNKHGFLNMIHYSHTIFDYPIPLPDQSPVHLPDTDGALFFVAYSVRVRFCDMPSTAFNSRLFIDPFIQIGLNDEDKSANFRPSWQRIIYHQGYRAGFLTLNVPFESLDLGLDSESVRSHQNSRKYRLVALSRDELPEIPQRPYNPSEPNDLMSTQQTYNARNIVQLHNDISKRLYYELSPRDFFGHCVRPPVPDTVPEKGPVSETGDAKWDIERFGPPSGRLEYQLQTKRATDSANPSQLTNASEHIRDEGAIEDAQSQDITETEADEDEYETYTFSEDIVYPLYNVLLVEEHGYPTEDETKAESGIDMHRYVTRVGVGKMHFQAFHHASPDHGLIRLR